METPEYRSSARYEKGPLYDLSGWRDDMVQYAEAYCAFVVEELGRRNGDVPVDINQPSVKRLVSRAMIELLNMQNERLLQHPSAGDRIVAGGDIIYDAVNQKGDDVRFDHLNTGESLHGTYKGIAIREYLDEPALDVDADQITEELIAASTRYFGPHIELSDVTTVASDGGEHEIPDCGAAYVPLVYQRLHLFRQPAEQEV